MSEAVLKFLPEELQIGVAEIDGQHDALFGRVLELKNNCLGSEWIPRWCADGLLQALIDHYATEERHAQAMGMDFSGHAREHENHAAGRVAGAGRSGGGAGRCFRGAALYRILV